MSGGKPNGGARKFTDPATAPRSASPNACAVAGGNGGGAGSAVLRRFCAATWRPVGAALRGDAVVLERAAPAAGGAWAVHGSRQGADVSPPRYDETGRAAGVECLGPYGVVLHAHHPQDEVDGGGELRPRRGSRQSWHETPQSNGRATRSTRSHVGRDPSASVMRRRRQGECYFADGLRDLPDNRRLRDSRGLQRSSGRCSWPTRWRPTTELVGRTYREAGRACEAQLGDKTAAVRDRVEGKRDIQTKFMTTLFALAARSVPSPPGRPRLFPAGPFGFRCSSVFISRTSGRPAGWRVASRGGIPSATLPREGRRGRGAQAGCGYAVAVGEAVSLTGRTMRLPSIDISC